MSRPEEGTTHLQLPTLKSNIKNDIVFGRSKKFDWNSKVFYDEINENLEKNERMLEEIYLKSMERINKVAGNKSK